ncbi:MAG: acyltransferase [Clostridiales bacterium]|nr:acyltransferase [Clostridiales bacterium]
MRNASIEILRFAAAAGVLFVHFEQFCGVETPLFTKTFIVVEFFFCITGYYMMKSIDAKTSEPVVGESIRNSFGKAKRIYGLYFFTFVLMFITRMVTSNITNVNEIMSQLFHFKWELFMLQMLGFNHNPQFNVDYLIAPGWYLSALFIALVPAYYLARHHKKAFIGFIGPLSVAMIYCYIIQKYNTLNVGNELVGGFIMLGVLRAFAGITFGALVYWIYKKLREIEFTKKQGIVASIIEAASYLTLVALIVLRDAMGDQDTLVYLAVYAILIICGDLNITAIDRFLNKRLQKICCYLGRLSMYIYLLHIIVVVLWQTYVGNFAGGWAYLIVFAAVFLFSVLVMYGQDKIREHHKNKVEKYL